MKRTYEKPEITVSLFDTVEIMAGSGVSPKASLYDNLSSSAPSDSASDTSYKDLFGSN